MGMNLVGVRKITKKEGKQWINVQSKFFTSTEICNGFGIRMGDTLKLRIRDNIFLSKVSDFITVPTNLVFSENEINNIKQNGRIRKKINVDILDIIKDKVSIEENNFIVGILSHLFSDGSISPTIIHFTNKDVELITHFESLVSQVFPNVKIDRWNDNGVFHSIIENMKFVSIISRFVDKFGRKSLTNPYVPKFIKVSEPFSMEWLKHSFTDEGWIKSKVAQIGRNVRFKNDELVHSLNWKLERLLKDNYPVITSNLLNDQLELVPNNNMLNDESEMLTKLGMKNFVRSRKKVHLINGSISVHSELSVKLNEFKNIGFCCGRKQRQLESIVNS